MKMKKKEMKKKIIRMKYLVTNPKFKREFNFLVFNYKNYILFFGFEAGTRYIILMLINLY